MFYSFLGNEYIHIITSAGDYKLKVELTDWEGEFRHALYTTFRLAGESDNYRITVYGYSGDAGNVHVPSYEKLNNLCFDKVRHRPVCTDTEAG